MSKFLESATRAQQYVSELADELPAVVTPSSKATARESNPTGAIEPPLRFEQVVPEQILLEGAPASRLAPALPDKSSTVAGRKLPLKVPSGSPVFPFDGTHPYASEQYRILRTKIMQHPKHPRLIVIASAGPRDGKTTNVINLAAVFALRSEARVLLIDGDIRRPSVAKQLGLPERPGLADVLDKSLSIDEAVVQSAQIPNLWLLTAGEATVNPSELLSSGGWKTLLARCGEQYDFVFVDSPPMAAVSDYALIQSVCDGVVLIVRQDHTKRRHCFEAVRQIPKDKLIGVVLNAVSAWPLDERRTYDGYYSTYGSVNQRATPGR